MPSERGMRKGLSGNCHDADAGQRRRQRPTELSLSHPDPTHHQYGDDTSRALYVPLDAFSLRCSRKRRSTSCSPTWAISRSSSVNAKWTTSW